MAPSLSKFLARSDIKLGCFGLAAVAAVYFGFLGLNVETAAALVKHFGYYVMLATFVLWLWCLWELWQVRGTPKPFERYELPLAGFTIGLLTLVAVTSESFRCKVLYDEFVLQSTAFNMHYFRDTATMVRGYEILGDFVSVENYLDKRPNFFPFLISLVHDLTGYRSTNAFLLNAGLFPVALGLTYYLGRRLNGWRGGMLAVLLLGSLPLLGQNATGSGMELLNVVMILAVAALSAAYLRQPDDTRLSALVIGSILLAQTRYESAIYVGPAAAVIAWGWWRQKKIILSWPAIVAPLLLLPSALQNKVLSNSKWMWELKENQDTRFSAIYLPGNVRAAVDYFFNTNAKLANSWPLSVLGLIALVVIGWQWWRRRGSSRSPDFDRQALVLISLGIVTNTVLIMFYYWSTLTDPLASRLSLPFYVLLAFAVVVAAAYFDGRLPVTRVLGGLITVFALGVSTGHAAQHLYSHLGIDELEWEKRYVAARPDGPRLVISNTSTIPWLLEKVPAILIDRSRLVSDRVKHQLETGAFREILVFQSMRPTTAMGDHELVPEDRLPAGFKLELLTEKRFGTKIVQVSRLTAVDLPPADAQQ